MKKSRILGYALTLAATLFVGSAMGQDVKGGVNYVELKSTVAGVNTPLATLDEFALVQLNKTYKFYAKPDLAFHPNYKAGATNWGLTANFSWTWTPTTAADVTITAPTGAEPANYVQILGKLVGAQKIAVTENAPAGFGGCSGTASNFFLATFPIPSFDVVAAGVTNDRDKKICASTIVAATDLKFEYTLASSGTPHVNYLYEVIEGEVTAGGTIAPKAGSTWADKSSTNVSETFAGTTWSFDQIPTSTATPVAGSNGFKLSLTTKLTVPTIGVADAITGTPALAAYNLIIQKKPVVKTTDPTIVIYRVTLQQSNGLISRNGDYDADGVAGTEVFYPGTIAAATNKVAEVYVLKSPSTGPVFHIGNNKAI
jgi:hypothetical protein